MEWVNFKIAPCPSNDRILVVNEAQTEPEYATYANKVMNLTKCPSYYGTQKNI